MSDRFSDVSDFCANWKPRTVGSVKEGNKGPRKVSKDSWIVGHYISTRQFTKKDTYTIHKFKVLECGDHEALTEPLPVEGGIYEFFGTTVLNNLIADKVQPGQCVKVQWMGKVTPEKEGARTYEGWKIFNDAETDPITIKNGVIIHDADSSGEAIPAEAGAETATAQVADDDDDDLPF